MRIFLVIVVAALAACSSSDRSVPAPTSTGSASAPTEPGSPPPVGAALAMDHVTLLQPEAVIGTRIADVDSLTAVLKAVAAAVVAYDAAHKDALPAELDSIVVARKGAIRVWLVAAKGDLSIPELDQAFAKLPAVEVSDGNVGAVVTLARPGSATKRGPYLPSTWKAAASNQAAQVDEIIEAVWPR